MATLPDTLRAELARCHPLARSYDAMGSTGAFACALLDAALQEAENALRSGDVAAVQQSVDRLRSFRDVMPDRTPARVMRGPGAVSFQARSSQLMATAASWARPPAPVQEQFFTWTRAA
jgi:hypothetical protein